VSDQPSYRPGHLMHWIHTGKLAKTPWGWRPGVVRSYVDLNVVVDYLLEPGSITLWHFGDLNLHPGAPVRVHEEWSGLETGRGWFYYARRGGGLGPAPVPAEGASWVNDPSTIAVTDLRNGVGLSVPVIDQQRHRGTP
jgi:hypothetical protein